MKTLDKIAIGTYVFVHGYEGVVTDEYMPGMYEVRLASGGIVVPTEEIKLMCAWCADKPATYQEYCDDCKVFL